MRLSRNRYWGHPDLIALVERVAEKAQKAAGWPGILVGGHVAAARRPDVHRSCEPSSGPRRRYLADADAEPAVLARGTRGNLGGHDGAAGSARYRSQHLDAVASIGDPRRRAGTAGWSASSSTPRSRRRCAALCREAKGDRSWLSKVRPMYGHDYHFHIRMKCPAGSTNCEAQPPPNEGEACSAGDLAYWFSDAVLHPKPPVTPPKPKPPLTLADLPAECRQVLQAP